MRKLAIIFYGLLVIGCNPHTDKTTNVLYSANDGIVNSTQFLNSESQQVVRVLLGKSEREQKAVRWYESAHKIQLLADTSVSVLTTIRNGFLNLSDGWEDSAHHTSEWLGDRGVLKSPHKSDLSTSYFVDGDNGEIVHKLMRSFKDSVLNTIEDRHERKYFENSLPIFRNAEHGTDVKAWCVMQFDKLSTLETLVALNKLINDVRSAQFMFLQYLHRQTTATKCFDEVARIDTLWFTNEKVIVNLEDGRQVSAPLEYYSEVAKAKPSQRSWHLTNNKRNVHFDSIRQGIYLETLLDD